MAEAAGCLVKHALRQAAIFRVQAFCDVENIASARTLEKIGMSREGILRRYIIQPSMSGDRAIVICTRSRDSLVYS